VNDFVIPEEKAGLIDRAEAEVKEIEDQYAAGLVTQGEKYNKVVDIWAKATDDIANAMMDTMSEPKVPGTPRKGRARHPPGYPQRGQHQLHLYDG